MSDELEEFAALVTEGASYGNNSEVASQPRASTQIDSAEDGHRPKDVKMWAVSGRDYFPAESSVDKLKPAQYSIKFSQGNGVYFSERDINLDNLLVLPDSNSEKVLNHIEDFWKNEDVFREYGFLWKRGIMLWGPPGSGKTSTVQQLSKSIVDAGGITVYCTNPEITSLGLDVMRRIEPDRPIIVIFEDIDAIISEYGESDILALLDGELQVDNVVFIATTNYPGRLDKRFINRPSRFDEIIKIPMPSKAAREFYLSEKNPRLDSEPHELQEWVNSSEGFSVAHLKELIISVECFGNSLNSSIKRLRSMMEATPDQYDDDGTTRKIGF